MNPIAVGRPFPRGALYAAGALIAMTLILIAVDRFSGGDPATSGQEPLASRELVFEDRTEGGVSVIDPGEEQVVAVYGSGEGGFVRGVLRALMRERKLSGIAADAPFLLSRAADGLLTLEDPRTGHSVVIQAFGATQVETFSKLLPADGSGR